MAIEGKIVPTQGWAETWCEHALVDERPVAVTIQEPDGKFTNLCADCAKNSGVELTD